MTVCSRMILVYTILIYLYMNFDLSLVLTITVTCYLQVRSSGDHLITCGAIWRSPHTYPKI